MAKITAAKLLRTAVQDAGQSYGMTYDQFHDWVLCAVLVDCFPDAVPTICKSALEGIRKETIKTVQGQDFKFYHQNPLEELQPGEPDARD